MFIRKNTESQPLAAKAVTVIDENGNALYNDVVTEITPLTIEAPCLNGFILPKWDGTQWTEGGTAPEPVIQPPTVEERLQAIEDAVLSLALGGIPNV